MSQITFEDVHARYAQDIEAELRRHVPAGEGALAPYYGMMAYHLGWVDENLRPRPASAGKRLRPLLCLVAAESAGGDYRCALPAAAGLELLHNYTLIHDDIEDRGEERRGRPTVWKLWGEALAINVGDGLDTLARLAIADLARVGVDPATSRDIGRVFDETEKALCEGQHLDMSFETVPMVSSEAYYEMIGKKTAGLLAASAQIGALAVTGDRVRASLYRDYGYLIGMAFQIQDDILGIWGSAAVTGKAASDIHQRKKTIPLIYAAEQAAPSDRATLRALLSAPSLTEEQATTIVGILDRCGAQKFAEARAEQYYLEASHLLTSAALEGPLVGYLPAIAEFLLKRRS